MHLVFATLIFIAVVIVTIVLFGGWVLMTVIRAIARLLGGPRPEPVARRLAYRPPSEQRVVRCPQTRCMADNPVGARFCRRCGQAIEAGRAARVRQVA
jgi:hypothetical protein